MIEIDEEENEEKYQLDQSYNSGDNLSKRDEESKYGGDAEELQIVPEGPH